VADLGTIVGASPLNADDTTYFTSDNDPSDQTTTVALGNMPSDFFTMDADPSYSLVVRLRDTPPGSGPDTYQVEWCIVNAAQDTVLAGASATYGSRFEGPTTVTADSDQTIGPTAFTYTNTTVTKSVWDGALIELRFNKSAQSMSPDANAIQADYFQITGTYTTGASATGAPSVPLPTASGTADNQQPIFAQGNFGRDSGRFEWDDFLRGTLGSAWDNGSGWADNVALLDGNVRASQVGQEAQAIRSGPNWTADHWCEITVQTLLDTLDTIVYPMARANGVANFGQGYLVRVEADQHLELYKVDGSGVFTSIGTDQAPGQTITDGDRIRIEAEGTTIRMFWNDVLQEEVTDSTWDSGSPGLGVKADATVTVADAEISNWRAGNMPYGGPFVALPTAAGTAQVNPSDQQATGAPSVPLPTASGAATFLVKANPSYTTGDEFFEDFNKNDLVFPPWDNGPGVRPELDLVAGAPRASLTGANWSMARPSSPGFTWDGDHWAEITIKSLADNGVNDMVGPHVRMSSGGSGYIASCTQNGSQAELQLKKMSSVQVYTDIGTAYTYSTNFVAGDRIRLEAEGTTLRAYINGVLVKEETDSTYSGNVPGLHIGANTSVADNEVEFWQAGELPFVPVAVPLPTAAGTATVGGGADVTATGSPSVALPTAAGTATIERNATGAPSVALPTSSGTATIERNATGAPSVALPTAAGTAEVIKTATGSPSVPLPTVAGTAKVVKKALVGISTIALATAAGTASIERNASGAPLVALPTAAGTAVVIKTATGSPSIAIPTAAGTATITNTATGGPSIALPTASGTVSVIKTATGAPSTALPTASGAAEIIKTASGAPSVPLLEADGSASVLGAHTANGAPSVALPTAAGTAGVIKTATGAPSVPLPTSSGSANMERSATGAPSVPLPTSAGNAQVEGVFTASGAPTVALPTTAGTATIERNATGSPSVPLPIAAGTAEVIKTATGTPSIPLPTASGVAEVANTASGAPSVPLPTASGTATVIKTASGSPSVALPTSSGTASMERSATGTPSIPLPTSAGNAQVEGVFNANGAPSVSLPTAAGSATVERGAIGSPSVSLPTAAGTAEVIKTASGSPSTALPTSSGTAVVIKTATGSPSTALPISSGTASMERSATGTPSIPLPTSAGNAQVEGVFNANGAPSVSLPIASGSATVERGATGSPSVSLPTAVGVAVVIKTAIGAPSVPLITAAGSATVIEDITATGAPSVGLPTASGTAEVIKTASGASSIPLPTASGSASVEGVFNANGAPSVSLPTAAGTVALERNASGTPSVALPTSIGTAEVIKTASGSPSITLPTASGSAVTFIDSSGSPSIAIPTTTGIARVIKSSTGGPSVVLPVSTGVASVIKTATGSPSVALITSQGTADKEGFDIASGSPSVALPVTSGTAVTRSYPRSDYLTELRNLQSRFAGIWVETPVQWNNVLIETKGLTEWVRFVNDSESSVQKSIGSDPDVYRHFGKIIIEIHVKPNSGASRALQLADLVADIWRSALFKDISMEVPELVIEGTREGWYRINVVCPYYRDSFQLRSI
jgi:hypothetical protein